MSRTHAVLAVPTSPPPILLRRTITKTSGLFESCFDNASLERPQQNQVAKEKKLRTKDKATTSREREKERGTEGGGGPPSWPKKAKQYLHFSYCM